MKMISRYTVIWLTLAVISAGYLTYRIYDFRHACLEQIQAHGKRASPQADSRDTVTLNFDPCELHSPTPVTERVFALILVVSTPVFLGSLIRDLFRRLRQRRVAKPIQL